MKSFTSFLAAAAAIGGVSAPLAAQSAYPYGYQQQVPQPYPGQPGYGYQQGYAQNPVGQIIDGLLGNRYNVSDRQAVSQCASAAMTQSAVLMTSRLCSITTTVLPWSARRWSTSSSLRTSSKWRPVVGSSRM
jgi:hypothetical protein